MKYRVTCRWTITPWDGTPEVIYEPEAVQDFRDERLAKSAVLDELEAVLRANERGYTAHRDGNRRDRFALKTNGHDSGAELCCEVAACEVAPHGLDASASVDSRKVEENSNLPLTIGSHRVL